MVAVVDSPILAALSCTCTQSLSPTHPSVFGVCDMTTLKPTYKVLACEQLRRRPACASAQLLFAIVLLAPFKTSQTPKTGLLTLFCQIIIKSLDFVACKKQRHRPACATAQSDQRLCYSLSEKYNSSTTRSSMEIGTLLVSLCTCS